MPIPAPWTSTTQTQAGGCRRVSPASKGETVRAKAGTSGDELLKIDQLASRLKVSVGCIRAWRLRGEGPPAIRIGTALRWDAAEVDEWLDSRRESRMEA
ncbi:MAG: helix-turn-helix domain-containing protein [Actinomycetota bacterium]